MSAEAQAKLQQLWEKLHFSTVKRTIAHEPEDILHIELRNPTGSNYPNGKPMFNGSEYQHHFTRTSEVPESERWRVRVSWRHYFGFTNDNIYFQCDDFLGLDMDINMTMTWSRWGNHMGGFDRPEDGQLICGEVIQTDKGRRFKHWFTCDEAFKLLVDIVRHGTDLSEDELGKRLLTDDWPDKYWAIARLVFFDNVQAFINEAKFRRMAWDEDEPEWARHPAYHQTYGQHGYTVNYGMSMPKHPEEFVGDLSLELGELRWWQEYLRLADEQGVPLKTDGLDMGPTFDDEWVY